MTVAHTLSATFYHIIANNKILKKLQEELSSVTASRVKWNRLEQLPYLVGFNLIHRFHNQNNN